MATIGTDCHLTITHADVNGGAAYGFILGPASPTGLNNASRDQLGPSVTVQREVSADGSLKARVYFTVLLADGLVNPDGSAHADGRATMYAKIQEYLAQTDGLTIGTAIGMFNDIGAQGHSATEMHLESISMVGCQLNNVGTYWPPCDPTRYENSRWRTDTETGVNTWWNSYWR